MSIKAELWCVSVNIESWRAAEDFYRGKTASTISFICAEMYLMFIMFISWFSTVPNAILPIVVKAVVDDDDNDDA